MMTRTGRASRFAFVLLALAGAAPMALAQEGDAYKGKTMKFVVGYGVGGGYDVYARMIAPALSHRLGATVVVENQPGAGGIAALNRVQIAPPDGLTIMIVNGTSAAFAQLTGEKGVRYDLGRLTHLGTVAASPWVWLVHKTSPVRTVADAIAGKDGRAIHWSAGGSIDGLSDGAQFTCAALKLNCKVVLGYKGSREAALAVMRGEMDAIYVSDTSAIQYANNDEARPIATVGRKRSRFFPDIPTIFEAAPIDAHGAWLLDIHATLEDLGRILVAPPGVPPERLAVLRDAVRAVLTDKAFVAEGERTQRYIDFVDAGATATAVNRVINGLTPAQRDEVRKVLDSSR